MKIEQIKISNLRNEEHFQFHTDIMGAIEAQGPESMGLVPAQWDKHLELYRNVDTILEQIRKSGLTDKIEEIDRLRDQAFRGFRNAVKAYLLHHDDYKLEAAKTLSIVFNHYGNLTQKAYAHQTGAIYNFIQDMREKYGSAVGNLRFDDWVDGLENFNNLFKGMVTDRDLERAEKPVTRMPEVRKAIDASYNSIVKSIEVYMLQNPGHNLEPAIKILNAIITRYKNVLAQRKGVNKMKNEK